MVFKLRTVKCCVVLLFATVAAMSGEVDNVWMMMRVWSYKLKGNIRRSKYCLWSSRRFRNHSRDRTCSRTVPEEAMLGNVERGEPISAMV